MTAPQARTVITTRRVVMGGTGDMIPPGTTLRVIPVPDNPGCVHAAPGERSVWLGPGEWTEAPR